MRNKSFYKKHIGAQPCDVSIVNKLALINNYKMTNKSLCKTQVGTRPCSVNNINKVAGIKCTTNDNSFYNKQLGRSCGVNSVNKVTNIQLETPLSGLNIINKVADVNYLPNNNSFYNKQIGTPICKDDTQFDCLNNIDETEILDFVNRTLDNTQLGGLYDITIKSKVEVVTCKNGENSFYNNQIGIPLGCLNTIDTINDLYYVDDVNYVSEYVGDNTFYNSQIGTPLCGLDNVNNVKYKTNNNKSFYNKQIKPPTCGINNNNTNVAVINIRSENVSDGSMNCDDTYSCLEKTIDDTTGNVNEIICRKQVGCPGSSSSVYIITVWKKRST
jgi:hypothetical protein